jgi:hypothetical protein
VKIIGEFSVCKTADKTTNRAKPGIAQNHIEQQLQAQTHSGAPFEVAFDLAFRVFAKQNHKLARCELHPAVLEGQNCRWTWSPR